MATGPRSFGKYLLDREIARGGMAHVWLARLRGLGGFEKRLVVKQILSDLARDPRFVTMFVEEAKTLVQLGHPHIVPVYELGVVDGVYFLAMEYVEGATLADMLEDGPLAPAEVAHVGVQIADALSYAHEKFAIVHRDVTPRNVMIDGSGHGRLLDFGIAAPADAEGGALFGTPGFLSPEQARREAVSGASDVFTLGATLLTALEGKEPFTRDVDRAGELREADVPRATHGDEALGELLARMMSPTAASRPDARAVSRALRGWLSSRHPDGAAMELGARADRARLRREARRASERPPPMAASGREPSGIVRTLAQSAALDALLAESDEHAAPQGTVPIPRDGASRSGRHEASTGEPRTTPLARVSAPPAEQGVAGASSDQETPAPAQVAARGSSAPAPRRGVLGLLIAVLAIGVAVAAIRTWGSGTETGAGSDAGAGSGSDAGSGSGSDGSGSDAGSSSGSGSGAGSGSGSDAGSGSGSGSGSDAGSGSGSDAGSGSSSAWDAGSVSPSDAGSSRDAGSAAAAQRDSGPRPRAADAGTRARAGAGVLRVTSAPPALVRVDGRAIGETPIRAHSLAAGSHRVTLEAASVGRSVTTSIEVLPGRTTLLRGYLGTDPARIDVSTPE